MKLRMFAFRLKQVINPGLYLGLLFCCLPAAVPVVHAQPDKILSGLCKEDVLKEKLLGIDRFKPVPAYGDSYWRDSYPRSCG